VDTRKLSQKECNVLLNERETAERLGLSVKALQKWRWVGIGLPYVKLGTKSIRYDEADIVAYIQSCRVQINGGQAA